MKSNLHQLVRTESEVAAQPVAPPAPPSAETNKQPRPPGALLTTEEIALYLGVSVRTIKNWVADEIWQMIALPVTARNSTDLSLIA